MQVASGGNPVGHRAALNGPGSADLSSGVRWPLLAAVVGAFAATRLLVAGSMSHLLLGEGGLEYPLLQAVERFADRGTWELLLDGATRRAFVEACVNVHAIKAHVSTTLLAGELHFAHTVLGVPLGDLLLRSVTTINATTSLALWWLVLTPVDPRGRGRLWLATLMILAPPVMVRFGLLAWGTQDIVSLLLPALALAASPWIRRPGGRAFGLGRSLVAGATSALAAALNPLLLLGAGGLSLFIVLPGSAHGRRAIRGARSAARVVAAGAAFAAVWWWIGRGGAAGAAGRVAEVFELERTNGWGLTAPSPLSFVRVLLWLLPGLLAAGWVAAAKGPARRGTEGGRLLSALAVVLVGWTVAVSVSSFASGPDPGAPCPRYLMPLFGAGCALSGALLGSLPRLTGLALGAALLLTVGPRPARVVDPGNLSALIRHDEAASFLTWKQGAGDRSHYRFGDRPAAVHLGYGLIRVYGGSNEWTWLTPSEVTEVDHTHKIRSWRGELEREGRLQGEEDLGDFYEGVGRAWRVLVPPSRAQQLEGHVGEAGEHVDRLRAGYGPGLPPT